MAEIYLSKPYLIDVSKSIQLNRDKKEVNPENTLRTKKGFSG